MTAGTSLLRRAVGWSLAVVLPIAVLLLVHKDAIGLTLVVRYLVLFVLAMVASKLGKWIVGSAWDRSLRSVIDDGVLSIVLSLVAYGAAGWLARHGGGVVHPAWAALAGAYLVMIWPMAV